MSLLQLFLIYSGYKSFIEQRTGPSVLLAYLLFVVILIFLLPEFSIDESDDGRSGIFITVYLFYIVLVNTVISYYLYKNLSIALIVGIVSFCLSIGVVFLKAIIFGESEIIKVSTIYIEEYRKLQGPKLSKRRFIDNFTVIPFFNKIQNLFHKDKREENDDL